MSVDINILRMLKNKQEFRRVFGRVPDTALNKETKAILDDYEKYFDKFPDHEVVDMDVFIPLFRTWHPTLTDERRSIFEIVLDNARADVPENVKLELMRSILELRLATDLANLLAKFDEGELPNINIAIRKAQDEFKADSGIRDVTYIQTDIHDILDEENDLHGIKSRISVVNDNMRPLRPGDFGILAGRPDKGKTTYVASEATFWAPQLAPDQNVLWLNNEGPGKRIYPRLYQAALGATRGQLLTLKQANVLKPSYEKVMGRLDKVRVVDIHGMDIFSVEQIIEANNAGIVIYDMVDNIRGFGSEARTDQRLEEMYKHCRELAVSMNHIGIATSQISAEGKNMQFPDMSMLKDSKTGKQGACDFIIMLGSLDDPGYSAVRWIGIPKNKMRIEGSSGDPRAPVKFDAMRARVEDIPIGSIEGDEDAGSKENQGA